MLPTTCMGKLENGCDNLLLLIKFSLQASTLILKQQSRTKINHKNSNRNKKHLVINSVNSNYPWKIIAIRSTVFSKNHPPVEEISYLTLKKWCSFLGPKKNFVPYLIPTLCFIPKTTLPLNLDANGVKCHLKRHICPSYWLDSNVALVLSLCTCTTM